MTEADISRLVEERFGEAVSVLSLERKPWRQHEGSERSWRDHLLAIFRRRLAGALQRGCSDPAIEEMKLLLSRLDAFTPDQSLHYFAATSERTYYAGWIVGQHIAYCIPGEREENAKPVATAHLGLPSVLGRFICIRNSLLARPAWLIFGRWAKART
jgi:hypothetical protein